MIKILYLPTGEYLTFIVKEEYPKEYTEYFDLLNIELYPTIEENSSLSPIDKIIKLINADKSSTILGPFSKRNKIIFPAIRNHFEIIGE